VSKRALVMVIAAGLLGCGTRIIELDPGRDDDPDAMADAPGDGPACVPGTTQCTNCLDDDADGFTDGFDIECTGSYDNDEGSFDTARTGDNGNVQRQDCFFDGNSNSTDDGCDLHSCCELLVCPADFPGPPFNETTDCPAITTACAAFCEPLVPPGCDCFGCCTVCPGGTCIDIYIHPAVSPDCDADTLSDPVACPRCTPNTACGQPCGGSTCVLCPGQTVADLPPSCSGGPACPDAEAPCARNSDCATNQFCAGGCCVEVVQ